MQEQSINNPGAQHAGAEPTWPDMTAGAKHGFLGSRVWVLIVAICNTIVLFINMLSIIFAANIADRIVFGIITSISVLMLVFVYKMQGAIGRFARTNDTADMAAAFNAQRVYYMILGILTILGVVVVVLFFIGAIINGIAMRR